MTVSEYLANPFGKGAAFGAITQQRANLDAQFQALQSKISSKTYLYRNTAIFHIIIPSQKDETSTYDVIIEIPFREKTEEEINLINSNFKVFSNCPSFIFTYANVFRTKGMLCTWLIDKYDPSVRNKAPARSNPYSLIGYERSIYLAFKYLKVSGKILALSVRNSPIKPSSYAQIAKTVRTQEQIMLRAKSKIKVDEPPKNLPPTKLNTKNKPDRRNQGIEKTKKVANSVTRMKKVSKIQKGAKVKKIESS